jgi:phosphoglycolate phosphatase-like HAD superfamily hydrolase
MSIKTPSLRIFGGLASREAILLKVSMSLIDIEFLVHTELSWALARFLRYGLSVDRPVGKLTQTKVRTSMFKKFLITAALALPLAYAGVATAQTATSEPLPSWSDTAPKKNIVAFVERVTKQGSPDFVPEAERIATFDNDGTLWSEQPMYFQLIFALDRVKTLAPQHPEWKDKEPFASLLKGDIKGALSGGEAAIFEIVTVTHSGMTTEEFDKIVRDWITTAKHPATGRLYSEMVYQPMLELLAYLRANGFKTFIVSGGGIDFMRVFAERVYGIPPEQIVGSSGKLDFELRDGKPVLMKLPCVYRKFDSA